MIVNEKHPDILGLVETRVKKHKAEVLLRGMGFTEFATILEEGFSGGLWVAWHE